VIFVHKAWVFVRKIGSCALSFRTSLNEKYEHFVYFIDKAVNFVDKQMELVDISLIFVDKRLNLVDILLKLVDIVLNDQRKFMSKKNSLNTIKKTTRQFFPCGTELLVH